ncbi:hypothetical protein SNE40_023661 [Patella caerulea]|uniref:Uncharacterized protein n=1 Tax=Patella caerulea TaxID=87958 RepID=A0AAN8FW22_PATCE
MDPTFVQAEAHIDAKIINKTTDLPNPDESRLHDDEKEFEDTGFYNSKLSDKSNHVYQSIRSKLKTCTEISNPYYAPDVMKYLKKVFIPLSPLWTGRLLDEIAHDTNSPAEGWMKIVKKDILQGKLRLRPGKFILEMLDYARPY